MDATPSQRHIPNDVNDGIEIMELFIKELKRRLREDAAALKAADFEMIRKLLADNAITIASVRAGNFGEFAQNVAENYPYPAEEGPE